MKNKLDLVLERYQSFLFQIYIFFLYHCLSLCVLYLLACQLRVTVGDLNMYFWWNLCTLHLIARQVRVTVGDLNMYFWWNLCTLYLIARQVRVTRMTFKNVPLAEFMYLVLIYSHARRDLSVYLA